MNTKTTLHILADLAIRFALVGLAIAVILMVTGCQGNRYDQSAGLVTKAYKDHPTNGVSFSVSMTPQGQLTNIVLAVTNMQEIAFLDQSDLKSKSVFSKSEFAAVGSRQGMLDNNAGVEATARTKAEMELFVGQMTALVQAIKGLPLLSTEGKGSESPDPPEEEEAPEQPAEEEGEGEPEE